MKRPVQCEACNGCWIEEGADRCIRGGPYRYVESGPWYDEWAEKENKLQYWVKKD